MDEHIFLDTVAAAELLGVTPGFLIHNRRTSVGPRVTWLKTGSRVKCRYKPDDLRCWAEDPVAHANQPDKAPKAVGKPGAGRPRGSKKSGASVNSPVSASKRTNADAPSPRRRRSPDALRTELLRIADSLRRLAERL
jgi:hypothetical protein